MLPAIASKLVLNTNDSTPVDNPGSKVYENYMDSTLKTTVQRKLMYIKNGAAGSELFGHIVQKGSGTVWLAGTAITAALATNIGVVASTGITTAYYGYIVIEGPAKMIVDALGSTIAAGDALSSGSANSGRGMKTTTTDHKVCAYALGAATADGATIDVWVVPNI